MVLDKLASAIYNDIVSGLRGYHSGLSLSMEQLKDDIIDTRLLLLKLYELKGILPTKDLALSINCIDVDCKNIEKCQCGRSEDGTPTLHFQIPLLYNENSIEYLGSVDRLHPFMYYTKNWGIYNKYRKRGKNKPYVYIDMTPNENGMYDCFVYNAPLLRQISITAVFKDPRQLDYYGCCQDDDNMNFIDGEVKEAVTKQKIQYYRLLAAPLKPNDQSYTTG